MTRYRGSLVASAVGFLLFVSSLAAGSVPEYDALRNAAPDGRRVAVSDFRLQRDAFTFFFEEGTFHFLGETGGRDFGVIFIGRGAYELKPATDGERHHLRLVTGDPNLTILTDRFRHLVLLFTDDTATELRAAGSIVTGEPDSAARAAWDDYLRDQRRTYQTNLHLRVLRDFLEPERAAGGVFLAPVDGEKHPPALIVLDPMGISAVAAKFAFLGGERAALYVADGEDQGFWYLSEPAGEAVQGRGRAATGAADAEHYEIRTTIDGRRIEAETTIRFRPTLEALRVLPLRILPKLRIESATLLSPDGEVELGVIQEEVELGRFARLFREEVSDSDAAIVFPAALEKEALTTVKIRYGGPDVIHPVGGRSYSVRARESWYPNLGAFTDLATYELTFRHPKRHSLISVGELVNERTEGKEKVSVWKSDEPMRVAGFNYGEFRKITRRDEVSGVEIDVYTEREWQKTADDTMVDALNTARIAHAYFGPSPYRRISVSQQSEWFFGQSWPSLVYLPTLALTTSTQRVFGFEGMDPGSLHDMNEFAKTVAWHEMAHQWWGHEIGWESYRDQWLSEGFSEFTAALVLHFTENAQKYIDFWDNRRASIVSNRGPVPNADAGAITQGFRLSSRRTPGGAQAVVYGKGGYVLHMLRMLFRDESKKNPDEDFMAMMKEFTAKYSGGNPSTDDFQAMVERHMTPAMNPANDGTMNWFFDQWVHGTDIPTLTSDLRAVDLGSGRYRIEGTITQQDVPAGFISVVPMYLDWGGGTMARLGSARLEGSTSLEVKVELPLPQPPRRVVINAMRDVLTRN